MISKFSLLTLGIYCTLASAFPASEIHPALAADDWKTPSGHPLWYGAPIRDDMAWYPGGNRDKMGWREIAAAADALILQDPTFIPKRIFNREAGDISQRAYQANLSKTFPEAQGISLNLTLFPLGTPKDIKLIFNVALEDIGYQNTSEIGKINGVIWPWALMKAYQEKDIADLIDKALPDSKVSKDDNDEQKWIKSTQKALYFLTGLKAEATPGNEWKAKKPMPAIAYGEDGGIRPLQNVGGAWSLLDCRGIEGFVGNDSYGASSYSWNYADRAAHDWTLDLTKDDQKVNKDEPEKDLMKSILHFSDDDNALLSPGEGAIQQLPNPDVRTGPATSGVQQEEKVGGPESTAATSVNNAPAIGTLSVPTSAPSSSLAASA